MYFQIVLGLREATRLEITDKIQSTRVLGSRETVRLTVTRHLRLNFLEREGHEMSRARVYFLEGERESATSRENDSRENDVI